MDIIQAQERSQNAIKQRNMLAITVIVMAIIMLAMIASLLNKDRDVILQPVLPKEMAISSSGISNDYLEAITRDTAQLALNRSPETLKYWMENILAIAAPELRGKLQNELQKILDQQNGSQITQFITIEYIKVDADALTSQVGGVLHTVVGAREVRKEHRTFQFNWKYQGLSLKLLSFGIVLKEDEKS